MGRLSDFRASRWLIVVLAALVMGIAGTYQFLWSSIRVPLGQQIGASEAALGTVFTLFVVFQTVSQFPAGWVRDRWGPRLPLLSAAVLVFLGYAGVAWAPAIAHVYLFYALGGIGAGTLYTIAVNTPVKWFDDRRGLATGVVTFSYAMLSFLLIPVVRWRIEASLRQTLLGLAVLAGVVGLFAVPVIRNPDEDEGASGNPQAESDGGTVDDERTASERPQEFTWRETVRTWQFWLLYVVFTVVHGVGLMIIGKVVAFAEVMGLPTAATVAASVVALFDGLGVVGGGSVSDWIGRERTIAGSFVLCGVTLAGATFLAAAGLSLAFVGLIGAAALFRAPAFSVIPSLVGDYYGASHSSENYALLYTSKLWGGIMGGTVTSLLVLRLGWQETFMLGAVLISVAGFATFLLRPVDAPSP